MDFSWSRDEEEFRQEIRNFLKAELPQGWNDTLVLDKESDEYIALAKGFTQTVGARPVRFVDDKNIGDLHHAGLQRLNRVARFRYENQQCRI